MSTELRLEKVTRLLKNVKQELGVPYLGIREVDRVAFIGDTHTATDITQEAFRRYYDRMDLMVFLGDYVDRGDTGVENICLILEKFLQNPKKVIILRGNHETPWTNEHYGFMSEVGAKFGANAYENFAEFFASMPYAVVVNGYLCVHGGIARTLTKVEEIANFHLPDRVPDNPVAYELLWNDPDEDVEEFEFSERGPRIYKYGRKVTENFIQQNALKGIIRAHESCDGFKINFGGQVTTVFSSRYHGASAGILLIQKGFKEYVKL